MNNVQNQMEVLYGRQPVLEVLRAGRRRMHRLTLAPDLKPGVELDEILSRGKQANVRIGNAPHHELDALCSGGHHQGVVAHVASYPYCDFAQALAAGRESDRHPLFLVLDHIEDPQNLGSLLRTADAAGVHGVFIPKRRAAQITPAVVRASAGASEHVRVCLVSNVVNCVERLKKDEVWIAGLEAVEGAVDYTRENLAGPMALVVGSEGRGMARLVREHCDHLISLPMHGCVGSLNVGVAGAIALYEILRQCSARK